MKKRFLSLLMAAVMLLSLVPVTAFAATTRYASGGGKLQTVIDSASSGDTIILTGDYTNGTSKSDNNYIMIQDKSLTIDLNGHTIDAGNKGQRVIYVSGDGTGKLTIKDSAGGGKITGGKANDNGGGAIYLDTGATLTMYGGSITGNTSIGDGSAINIHYGAVANIYGGEVCNNKTLTSGKDRPIVLASKSGKTSGALYLGGTVKIYGNKKSDGSLRNLGAGGAVHIVNSGENALKEGAEIWLNDGSFKNDQQITGTVGGYLTSTNYQYFFADPDFSVIRKTDGKYYAHKHNNWTYTASGATLTANCKTCSYTVPLTVSAPANANYDGTTNRAKASLDSAAVEKWNRIVNGTGGVTAPSITYTNSAGESVSQAINGGTYYANIKAGSTTAQAEFTVNRIAPTAAKLSYTAPGSLTYDGNDHVPTFAAASGVTGLGNISVDYYLLNGEKVESAKMPGEYTVYAKVDDTGCNYTAANGLTSSSWKFTIVKNTSPVTINAEGESFTYGDANKTGFKELSVTDHEDFDLSSLVKTYYKETATAGEYESTGSTTVPTDVGNYKVVISVPDTDINYEGSTSVTFSIAPKALTESDVEAISDVAYTGSELKPTVVVKDGEKTLAEGTDYAVTYTNNTEVGTATATITLCGNYTGTINKSFNITKAEQTITASATQLFTYGDTGKAVSVTDHVGDGALSFAVKSGDSVSVDAETGALTIQKIGDTVITVTAAETNNYNSTSKDITVKIGAKAIDKPTATTTNFVYTGEEQTYLPTGFDANTMSISGNKQTNANETGYTVTVTPKANYVWSTEGECKFTWKIGRKTAELQWTTPSDLVYSNSAKVPTVAVTNLESGDTCTVIAGLTAENDNINVGTFTFTASGLSDNNYKLPDDVISPEYTITAKPITVTGITAKDKTYDGKTDATLVYTSAAFVGLVEGEKLAVSATGNFVSANVKAGETVNITNITLEDVTGRDDLKNYVLAESGNQATTTANITKKDVTVTITPKGGTYAGTITGAAAQLNGLVTGESFTPVLTYTGTGYDSTNVPANAGTYTVTANLPEGASNYNLTGTVTAEFTITKADGSVTAPTAVTGLVYNGQDQALINAGSSTTGEVQYKLGTDGKYSTGIPKAKAAGDYTVYYKVVGDSNHEDVAESSVIVTITKATYDMSGVTFGAAENVYDGAAHHPTITGTLPTGADGVPVKVSYSDGQTTVGEKTVTATFASTSPNYDTPAPMTAKQTVTAKPVTLAWGESRFTYDGKEKTVSVTVEGLVSGETCTATLTGNSATNAGDYTAKVTGLSSSNYELTGSVEKAWSITKAAQDAPARGEGYTISGTTLTAKSGYELYNGNVVQDSFTMAAGGSYSVRMIGDSNHFASPYTAIDTKVTVSVLAVPGSMGTVTGGGSYDIGSNVTLIATARSGYEFVEWQNMKGEQVGTTTSYTIEGITAGQTLIAAFKPKDKVMAVLPAVTQDRTYTGSEITGLSGGSGWTLVRGDLSGINAGDYSAVIKLADGYDVWPDGTTADKTVGWNIFKAPQNAPVVTAGENTLTVQPAEGKTAEYRKQGESDYTTVPGTVEATPGTYYVRYRETENYYASPITVVVVSQPTLNVVTLQPSDLSSTGVTFNGVVAPYDAEKVSEVGFEYVSIDKNGIVSAPNTISATEDQTFSAQVNDLTEDTDYQVRAYYVKRGNTTTYGSLVAFHTPKTAPVAQDNGKIKVNATVEGAPAKLIVSIERGNDVIASQQSDSAVNSYTANFDNLPYGNYNVVVRTNNGHYTETKLLSIVDDSEVTVNFTVPAGKLAAIVEVKTPDTPKTAVDGLGEVLTKADKDAAANGSKDVEVKLEVEKKAESNAAGAEEIKELLSGNDQILFLDMSLLKTTTELDAVGNATSIDTENIGAANDKVMEIAVPYSDTTKAPKVLRYHNGMAESLTELDARPTAPFMDGTYFVDEGYVFIYASGFSTYAISYAQSTSHGGHGGSANVISAPTGDAGLALYGVLTVSSMLGMGWIGKKKRDDE